MENVTTEELNAFSDTIFKGFTQEELKKIIPIIRKETFPAGETLFEEGHSDNEDLYILANGEVKILKLDREKRFHVPIKKLKAPDLFGEMSFLDATPRASTVETATVSTIYILSKKPLLEEADLEEIHGKLIVNIASSTSHPRIKEINAAYVQLHRTSVEKYNKKHHWGLIFFVLTLIAGVLNVLFYLTSTQFSHVIGNLPLPWVYWWAFGLLAAGAAWKMHFYNEQFGLSLTNIKDSLMPYLILTGVSTLLIAIIYWFSGPLTTESSSWIWLVGFFFFCVAYEYVGRGILISSTSSFFEDHRGIKSVLTSAIFLTLVPLPAYFNVKPSYIAIYLLLNCVLGWLFFLRRNLIGLILLHFVVGALMHYTGYW